MKATLAIVIKDVSKAKSKETVRTLYLRVTIKGQQLYIDTGQRCAIKNFYNKNNQYVRSGTPYADQINSDLRKKLQETELLLARASMTQSEITVESIRNVFTGKFTSGIKRTLYNLLEEWHHTRKLSQNSYDLYKISIDSLLKFCDQAGHEQLSAQVINDYTSSKYFNQQYFQIIRFLLVALEKKGQISKYVLEQIYEIKHDKNKVKKEPVALTELEIAEFYKVWKSEMSLKMQSMVIASFVLLCETGMRLSDMLSLNDNDIRTLNGVNFIQKNSQKGNKQFAVPLSDRAKEIIHFYKKSGPYFEFFPSITTQKSKLVEYHKILNKVSKEIHIDKHLTSHVGRHSFITIMSQKGVHMAHIQSMVGHSDYKMTERYKSLDKSAAFKDFFAATTHSKDLANKYYQVLVGKIRNKIIEKNVSDAELNKALALHGVSDDVNDYLTQKKIMGAVAYYALQEYLLGH